MKKKPPNLFEKASQPSQDPLHLAIQRYQVLQDAIRKAFRESDALLEAEILPKMPPGVPVLFRGKKKPLVAVVLDNFAGSNVCFRPKAIRRFELEVK